MLGLLPLLWQQDSGRERLFYLLQVQLRPPRRQSAAALSCACCETRQRVPTVSRLLNLTHRMRSKSNVVVSKGMGKEMSKGVSKGMSIGMSEGMLSKMDVRRKGCSLGRRVTAEVA